MQDLKHGATRDDIRERVRPRARTNARRGDASDPPEPCALDRARMRRALDAPLGDRDLLPDAQGAAPTSVHAAARGAQDSPLLIQIRRIVRDEVARGFNREGDEVLTRAAVANLLGVCSESVTKYVRQEGLPCRQLGAEYRFRRSEVMAWLSQRSQNSEDR